jgi:predicted nucleotidyltransferase
MALSENKVNEIIYGYIKILEQEIPIKEVFLFGSYASGAPKDYSDIDLAVVSSWFEGRPKIENMQYLSRISASYNSLVEAIPFTETEYRNIDKRTLLSRIVRTGRKVSTANPQQRQRVK